MENAIASNINNIKISEIFVGKADGLKEAQEKNFNELFYKGNDIYQELCESKSKFIISGKKGTGKTILAKYFEFEQNQLGNPTKLLTDRDVILRQFVETGKIDLEDSQRELFIEFTILTELGKLILENSRLLYKPSYFFHWYKIKKHLNHIRLIVEKRNPSGNFQYDSFSTSFKQTDTIGSNSNLESEYIKSSLAAETIEEKEISRSYTKNPYYNTLNNLRESIVFILKFMSVNLIFDDLDEYDDIITGNHKYINFFNDFIKVTNRINSDIFFSEQKCSRVIIIIRSDMLQPLNNASKNLAKIIADSQIKLNWIKKVPNGKIHPLMELVATKIKKSNILLKDLEIEEIINRFFCTTVRGIPVIHYMLNSSFGRPRDIINMLNVIIEENKNATKFSSKHFQYTKKEYSKLFLNELRNELASHYESGQIDECFWILKKINKNEFWIDELEALISTHNDELNYFKTAKHFYEFAYEYGIIGNVWQTKNDDGSHTNKGYSWKYREDGRDIPDETQKFCVHFALNSVLIHK